jgi:hypothetical protein
VTTATEFAVRGQRFRHHTEGERVTLEQWEPLRERWVPLPGTFLGKAEARAYARWVAST